MQTLEIVGLGLSTVDILARMEALPAWDMPGHRLRDLCVDGGGPVGTAIVTTARLGARSAYVGICGNDEMGDLKMAFFTRYGVDISRVVRRSHREEQLVLCYVNAQSGERLFGFAERVESVALNMEELDREFITSAQFLHLDGFDFHAAMQAARWMKEAGKPVVLDAAKTQGKVNEQMRSLVQLTDVLICGAGFGQGLTGENDLWQNGRAMQRMGPGIVVQTEGEDGCYTTTASEEFHTPAYRVDVVDTTGAGDVFHGAYIVGLLHGWDVHQVAAFASAVAAIKCTKMGGRAGIPDIDSVFQFLDQRDLHLRPG